MSKNKPEIAEDYRARAAVFRAFAVETISPEISEELLMLAEGFDQLADDSRRHHHRHHLSDR